MKGIHPKIFKNHIYIKEDDFPIRQTRRGINPRLKGIVKQELQKLLGDCFIYPIFDNEWVSTLVIIPNKGGEWRICVDYIELNKATKRDHSPLPFND